MDRAEIQQNTAHGHKSMKIGTDVQTISAYGAIVKNNSFRVFFLDGQAIEN